MTRLMLFRRLVTCVTTLGFLGCSGTEPDSSTPSGTTEPVSPSNSASNEAPSSASETDETAGEHILTLPEGFVPVEGWVAQPFPETCDATSEQKCNGACVGQDGEVNGCAFVNSSVIWRGMVSDEQGTYIGQGGTGSNSLLFLDPSQHRLVEFGSFAGTQSRNFQMALDAQNVYVTAEGDIVAFPRNGGATEVVASGIPTIISMIVVDGIAYGELFAGDELAVIPLNGDPVTTLPFEGDDLLAAAPDFFYTQEGAIYRVSSGDVANPTLAIEVAPNRLLGVRGDWLYGIVFATTIFELHRWPKEGGAGQRVGLLTLGAASLSATRMVFSCPSAEVDFVCSFDLEGGDPRVHGYLPTGAPSISLFVADDQYVYAAKGTLLARFPL